MAQIVLIRSSTVVELIALVQAQIAEIQSHPDLSLADFAEKFEWFKAPLVQENRIGFVAENTENVWSMLQLALQTLQEKQTEASWNHKRGITFRSHADNTEKKVAALFPGQGAQFVQMGADLLEHFPEFSAIIEEIDSLFIQNNGYSLSSILYPAVVIEKDQKAQQEEQLTLTEHAQPAIGAVSAGMMQILKKWDLKIDMTGGHSFGEITALWAAGVYDTSDFLKLACARGKAMSAPKGTDFDPGTMMAVKSDLEKLQPELANLPDIRIANLNAPQQIVLAGATQAVHDGQKYLKSKGITALVLPVSAAFHTPLVGHAQKPFAEFIERTTMSNPLIPVYSNSLAQAYPSEAQKIKTILVQHILQAVRFVEQIQQMYTDGARIFIEIGPKNILSNLTSLILADKPHDVVALCPSAKTSALTQLQEAWVQLQVLGLTLKKIS